MSELQEMATAPKDGTEILAYHACKSFHPVAYNSASKSYSMRWNKDYIQYEGDYHGWLPMPELNKVGEG